MYRRTILKGKNPKLAYRNLESAEIHVSARLVNIEDEDSSKH